MLTAIPGFGPLSPASNAFTENLSIEASPAVGVGGTSVTVTFTPAPPILVTNSLQIYVLGSSVGAGISINGGSFYAIGDTPENIGTGTGGGTVINNISGSTGPGWFNLGSIMGLSFPFTLSSLVIRGNSSGTRGGRITSLQVDGFILVQGNPPPPEPSYNTQIVHYFDNDTNTEISLTSSDPNVNIQSLNRTAPNVEVLSTCPWDSNQKRYSVQFATPFSNNSYNISVSSVSNTSASGNVSRTYNAYQILSKTASGFIVQFCFRNIANTSLYVVGYARSFRVSAS